MGEALVALGHGWQVVNSEPHREPGTLNLQFIVNSRQEGNRQGPKTGVYAFLSLITLTLLPHVTPTDLKVLVTAHRGYDTGYQQLLVNHEVGRSAVKTVMSLNPAAHLAGSNTASHVNRAIAADIVVAMMNQLKGVQQ